MWTSIFDPYLKSARAEIPVLTTFGAPRRFFDPWDYHKDAGGVEGISGTRAAAAKYRRSRR